MAHRIAKLSSTTIPLRVQVIVEDDWDDVHTGDVEIELDAVVDDNGDAYFEPPEGAMSSALAEYLRAVADVIEQKGD